ncbi:MAG: ABC transporter permease, partial [Acidobacteria bacterium]|nr:ABC transporter permease [Acidobacteriota bacterium]
TATAVLLLALGIGLVTAVFSLVDAVLLAPLPFEEPDRLVWLWQSDPPAGVPMVEISFPVLRDLQERSRSFETLAGLPSTTSLASYEAGGESVDVTAALATGNFFSVLGVDLPVGRGFLPEEDRAGSPAVVVISHRFWQQELGGDPHVLERSLRLDGSVHQVVGVAPEGFSVPAGADLWTPMSPALPQYVEDRGIRFVHGLGRLAEGVHPDEAKAELEEVLAQVAVEYPQFAAPPEVVLTSLEESLLGGSRPLLLLSLGAVLLVLLVACTNVAHLFLVRGHGRRREMTVRAALGAGRGQLVQELLLEMALLTSIAVGLGLLVAQGAIHILKAMVPAEVPRLETATLDPRALAVAALATLLAAAGAALLPSLKSSLSASAAEALRTASGIPASGRGSSRRRSSRSLLAVSEIALSLVLLLGASLLVRSLLSLRSIDPGFSPRKVLAFTLELPADRYPEVPRRTAFFERLEEELAALPRVAADGAVLMRPLKTTNGWDLPVT